MPEFFDLPSQHDGDIAPVQALPTSSAELSMPGGSASSAPPGSAAKSAECERIVAIIDSLSIGLLRRPQMVTVVFDALPSEHLLAELREDPRVQDLLVPEAPAGSDLKSPIVAFDLPAGRLPAGVKLAPDLIFIGSPEDLRLRLGHALRRAGVRRIWFVTLKPWLWTLDTWTRLAWLRSLDYRVGQIAKLPLRLSRLSLLLPVAWREHWRHAHGERSYLARLAKAAPLATATPLLPPEAFATGGLTLVNNALAWGGVERQVVYVLKGVVGAVHRPVSLLCLRLHAGDDYRFFLPTLQHEAVEARDIRSESWAVAALKRCLSEQQLSAIAATIDPLPEEVQSEVCRFLAEFLDTRPAAVHAWQDSSSLAAGYAAVLAGVPRVILSSRNMKPTNFVYHKRYMVDAYRALAAVPRVILVNNSEAGAADYAAWMGVARERFIVKRNGIDTALFRRPGDPEISRFRAALEVPEDAPLVGSVFRLYDEKRPLLWVEMAALVARRHPRAHFVVFGTGPLQSAARALGNRRGLGERLHLPGTTQEPQVAISAMDLFVLTSSFEGTPNVVLEAQLLGVPVVATDAGGTREALDHGRTGWLVQEPTAAALSERALAVLADPAWRQDARAAAPRFVAARFGLPRMIAETLSLYGLNADLPDQAGSATAPAHH